MFNKPPKFIDASDVINISIPNIASDVHVYEKKKEIVKEEDSIIIESKTESVNTKEKIKKDISSTKFRYAGDDIPWIF